MHGSDTGIIHEYAETRDHELFRTIIDRYSGLVYSACHRVLADHARAEEACQDTFFQLLSRPTMVTGSLAGWLHTVATRTSIDILRKDVARGRRENAAAQLTAGHEPSWSELSTELDAVLLQLPENERDLLIHHFLNGVTQAELARIDGISQATISRRIDAALNHVRDRLQKRGVSIGSLSLTGMLMQNGQTHTPLPSALLEKLNKMVLLSSHTIAESGRSDGTTIVLRSLLRNYRLGLAGIGVAAAVTGAAIVWYVSSEQRTIEQTLPIPPVAHTSDNDDLTAFGENLIRACTTRNNDAIAALHLNPRDFAYYFPAENATNHYTAFYMQYLNSIQTIDIDTIMANAIYHGFDRDESGTLVELAAGSEWGLVALAHTVRIYNDAVFRYQVDDKEYQLAAATLIWHAGQWYCLGPISFKLRPHQ